MGIITTMRAKETLESELYKRGLSRANELAKFAVNPLLRQDLPMLRRFVNHSSEHEYVLYVMILDNHGRVVMHSDLSEVGKTYKDKANFIPSNTRKTGFTPLYRSKKKELYCDISTTIQVADVLLGSVWLGYSYAAIEKEIARAKKQIILIGLATISIGMVVAYFLAAFISSPIKKVTYAVEQVAGGHFDTPLSINRNDEIGALASAFNRMTEDLRSTTVSKDYVDSIIGSMKDTLIVVDQDENIRTVNKATCDLLGYEEEELIGKNIHFVVLQKSASAGAEETGGMLNPNQEIEEIAYLTKTGKQIPMLFSAAALKNKDKKIVAFVIIARDVTERKQAEEALRQSEQQLHFLSSQLLIAQEKERKRLSIELHDELGQSLMVVKLWLRSIQGSLREDQPELKRDCDEMTVYINEISENIRRLSRDLSPSILVDLGLSVAIRSLVTSFTKRCNIENSLDIMDLDTKFSKEGQITVYRIVQECLTNIAKHAQATHVSVVIKEQDGHVYFCVQDNGKGFGVKKYLSNSAPAKGIGLAAMFEQVRMLGGSLDIWSQEAVGTKITFTLPLDARG
jgi:PAS domain S-box-containing protein